jgi:hypothetical protein
MMTTPGRTLRLAPSVLVLLLAACADAADQVTSGDAAAELEASVPHGRYAATYVLESSNVPGAKERATATSTYAFTVDKCDDAQCTGSVKAPAEGSFTWDGTSLVVTFDEIGKHDSCRSRDGQPMKGSTFWSNTKHWANLTTARTPARLKGSYQQETVFSDFTNGCEPARADRQWAKFSLLLKRQ